MNLYNAIYKAQTYKTLIELTIDKSLKVTGIKQEAILSPKAPNDKKSIKKGDKVQMNRI